MTVGNMRANGVRTLAAWCLGRGCNHSSILTVDGYPDEMLVQLFGPRRYAGSAVAHGAAPSAPDAE
jgi:hypothetical protein